jgi:hypothetical protein
VLSCAASGCCDSGCSGARKGVLSAVMHKLLS